MKQLNAHKRHVSNLVESGVGEKERLSLKKKYFHKLDYDQSITLTKADLNTNYTGLQEKVIFNKKNAEANGKSSQLK